MQHLFNQLFRIIYRLLYFLRNYMPFSTESSERMVLHRRRSCRSRRSRVCRLDPPLTAAEGERNRACSDCRAATAKAELVPQIRLGGGFGRNPQSLFYNALSSESKVWADYRLLEVLQINDRGCSCRHSDFRCCCHLHLGCRPNIRPSCRRNCRDRCYNFRPGHCCSRCY